MTMARTTPTTDTTDVLETATEAAPVVTLESVNPEAARAIDDFVQAHLPKEPFQQQAAFRDREALKILIAQTLLTK